MERPSMNMQKVARCMKTGKSKAACMKEVYPDGAKSSKTPKKSSKTPARKSGGY